MSPAYYSDDLSTMCYTEFLISLFCLAFQFLCFFAFLMLLYPCFLFGLLYKLNLVTSIFICSNQRATRYIVGARSEFLFVFPFVFSVLCIFVFVVPVPCNSTYLFPFSGNLVIFFAFSCLFIVFNLSCANNCC